METVKAKLEELKPALFLFYLSCMGSLCMFAVQAYLGTGFEPLICISFMGIIFGIYTFNRFTDTTEDFATDLGRLLFFQRKKGFLALALAASAGSLLALSAAGELNWMHGLLIAVGFTYSYRILPWYDRSGGFRLVRIKEMTIVKNLAVSLLWGASVFLLPILSAKPIIQDGLIVFLLAAGLALATLNNTLFDDILDEAGDRAAGIRTLPTTIGKRNSYLFLWGLDGLWILTAGILLYAGRIDMPHAAFLALLGAYPLFYMGLTIKGWMSKVWLDFVAESDLLLFSLGMVLLGAWR